MFSENNRQWLRWGRNGVFVLCFFWFVLSLFIYGGSQWSSIFLVPVIFPIVFLEYFFPNLSSSITLPTSPLITGLLAIICYFVLGIIVGYLNSKFKNQSRIFVACILVLILISIFYILPH